MKSMNEKIMYGAVGIILGVVLMNSFTWAGYGATTCPMMSSNGMMHNSDDMGGMMDGMMSGLKGKTGDTFDKAFLSEMIIHHEDAVNMAKEVLAKSKRPELIQLANEIVNAQTREIDMMKNWSNTWFK